MTFFQAPYLEIKKQMDKQDPLAHPLLQWYTILVFLFLKTASFSTACFKRGGGRGRAPFYEACNATVLQACEAW